MTTYDAIIVGTGQAGPHVAQRLTAAGMKVAIIERKLFGGTCVNTGCIPTKAMVASAYAARMVARAAEYGVMTSAPTVDMKRVKARKDAISGASRVGLEESLRGNANCTVIQGHARFEGPHELSVNGERIASERIFLNVGARAIRPEMPGLDRIPYLTNTSMLEVDFVPEHLLIVGGSYIGLEFGQMFRRFGSAVSIIEKGPRVVPHEDEDISAAIQQILEDEGIGIHPNAECIAFSARDGGVEAHVQCSGEAPAIGGTHVLMAVGRRPNTDDLGLENAGIHVDARGYIEVDDELRTNVPGVWALGDCNGHGGFTHTSWNDSEIVTANLLDNDPRRLSDRITTYGLFIDPPLARAGLNEDQVRKSGRPALIGKRAMTRVGRAVEKGETQGFMKILVDAETHRILGAAILGTGGDEAIHCILDVMYAKAPYTVIERAVHIHPTVSELIPTMLGELKVVP